MYKIAIQSCPRCIVNIPEDIITKELCRLAISIQGDLYLSIPEQYRSCDLLKLALKTDTSILDEEYISSKLSMYGSEFLDYLYDVYPYKCTAYGDSYIERFKEEYSI